MPRYQLRTVKEENLERIVHSMVEHAWYTAKEYFDFRKLQPEDFTDFKDQTRRSLRPYLAAFDLCGMAFECSGEVEGAPLLNDEDRIYHLIVPENFSQFVSEVSAQAFRSIKHLALPGKLSALQLAIEHAFQRRLREHIYYNPACGKIDICNVSQPVNPWKH